MDCVCEFFFWSVDEVAGAGAVAVAEVGDEVVVLEEGGGDAAFGEGGVGGGVGVDGTGVGEDVVDVPVELFFARRWRVMRWSRPLRAEPT